MGSKHTPFSARASTSRVTRRPMPPRGARKVGPGGGVAPRKVSRRLRPRRAAVLSWGATASGGQLGGVAGVDAAEQRVDQALGHLAARGGG